MPHSLVNFVKQAAEQLGKKQLVALLLALCVIIGFVIWFTALVEQRHRQSVADNLQTILLGIDHGVKIWADEHRLVAENIAGNDIVLSATNALLLSTKGNALLLSTKGRELLQQNSAQEKLHNYLQSNLVNLHYGGFFIIGPDNINLASSNGADVGAPNLLTEQPDVLARLWAGETAFSRIQPTDETPEPNDSDNSHPTMFIGAPIKNSGGRVIALLALRINPYDNLFPLLEHGRLGKTGETYLFNSEGLMLSDSRFVEQLFNIGLLKKNDSDPDHKSHSHLKISLRDPGANLTLKEGIPQDLAERPLTRMAASAIRGESGTDINGYRDYRGVLVVGAWMWDNNLGVGIATEQDLAESYTLFYFMRNIIYGGGFVSIVMLLLISYQYAQGRRQLRASQDRLSAVLNNVIDSILVIDSNGVIKDVNPVTEDIFGYSKQDLVGQNVSMLMPEPYASQHNGYIQRYLQSDESKIIDVGREVEARHANGNHFPIDLGVSRLELDDGLHFVGVIRDISESKKAIQDLEDERTFTREVLDSLSARIAVLDEEGTIILTNAAWDHFAEENDVAKKQIGIGTNYLEFSRLVIDSDSDNASEAVEEIRKMVTGEEEELHLEYPSHTLSGKHWFQMFATRFLHADRPAIVVSHLDITQRVSYEDELRITSLVAENTDNAVIVTDLEGRIEWVNQGFTALSGYHRDEVVGHKPGVLLQGPGTDSDVVQTIREAFHARKKVEGEILNYRKDGEPYWINFEISPVHDNKGNVSKYVALEQDITDQKQMLEELNREKDATEAAINMLSITRETLGHTGISEMWIRAKDGRIIRSNEQACNHLNYSREKLLSLSIPDFDPNYPMEHLREAIQSIQNDGWKRFESIHQTSDGRRIPVEITAFHLPDYDDHGDILIVFVTDITQRKEAESELIQARAEAEEANHAKSTFLATMSHEIRTPLNGVVGTIEMLGYSHLDSSQRDLVATAKDSANLLQVIIDDILDFSKIEAGRLELELVPVVMETLVEQMGVNLQSLAHKRDVELLIYIDPRLPELMGDPVRLHQILYNLAGNAIKFSAGQTDQKGLAVISVQLERQDNRRAEISLNVRDNGIGMNPEVQKRLFQPFVQGESETTRHFGGTGLGLVITQRLVEIMEGMIEMESTEGQGTSFSVYLSLELSGSSEVLQSSDLKGIKVVLVEDNSDAAWIFANYLEHAGAEITITTPDEALDTCWNVLARNEDSVVVIDTHVTPEVVWPLYEKLRTDLKDLRPRFVLVERGRRRNARISKDDCIVIDLDVLHRSVLLNAVAAAVGRESPKHIPSLAPSIISTDVLAGEVSGSTKYPLLLADDNETNRKVIGQQLQLLGYTVDFAVDGKEALEMWRDRDYALLLTDCHMPEMDGYQLSEAIRQEEHDGEHKPILAITADAMKGTSKKCLAAGMDDYLTKPIEMSQLQQALLQWLPAIGQGNDVATAPKQPGGSSDVAIDPLALGNLLGTQERAMLADYYREFLETSTPTFNGIQEAFNKNDLATMASLVHKMKSPAKTLGANGLAECCQVLELALKAEDTETVKQQMPQFTDLFAQFRHWIEQNWQ